MPFRRVLVSSAVAILLLSIHGLSIGFAQSTVATPTAEGCDQVPKYIKDRQAADALIQADWDQRFPATPFAINVSQNEYERFLLSLSPEEFEQLAAHYLERVKRFDEIDAAPIMQPYHELTIERAKVNASLFQNAATVGILTARIAYAETVDQIIAERTAYAYAAALVCPAFLTIPETLGDAISEPTATAVPA